MSEHLRDIAAKAVWDARRDRLTLGGRHIEIGDWPPPDSEVSDCGPYPMADDYRAIGEAVVDAVTPHIRGRERANLYREIIDAAPRGTFRQWLEGVAQREEAQP